MDTDEAIKDRIASEVASEVILADRTIDRRRLAEIVFSDAEKLNCLNSIVHVAVIADIMRWRDANAGRARLWVESAIIYESGIDRIVNDVWEVTAPEELRVERVMKRNGISRREVIDRIRAQARTAVTPHPATLPVINDGIHPLLPQIDTLLHS